jgi:uncharacterized protein YrrD
MEQGSYMLIERGMTVQGIDGELGSVSEVVADAGADIFRGLVLTHGLLLPKQVFIPAENVVGVADRRVQINLTKTQAERLAPPTFTKSETQATDI